MNPIVVRIAPQKMVQSWILQGAVPAFSASRCGVGLDTRWAHNASRVTDRTCVFGSDAHIRAFCILGSKVGERFAAGASQSLGWWWE